MATDPICGMQVDESTGRHADRGGQRFYFCSDHCRKKFLATVSSAPGSEGATARPATQTAPPDPARSLPEPTIYTCPMHPEIEQDHSGNCPKCGMALEPKFDSSAGESDHSELDDMTRRFSVAAVLATIVWLMAMLPMVGVPVDRLLGESLNAWLQLALSTPVVVWAGAPFFRRGWQSLVTRNLNMFTLIAIGTGTAYAYSLVVLLWPNLLPEQLRRHGHVEVYFEAAAVIVALVLLGQVLELQLGGRRAAPFGSCCRWRR